MAKGDVTTLEEVMLFNSSSSSIGISLTDGRVITMPPFSITGTPMPRSEYEIWSKTVVGQAYMDKGIVCTKQSDKVGFDATSDLVVPPELAAMPTQGGTEAELVKKPTLDGGATLPVG